MTRKTIAILGVLMIALIGAAGAWVVWAPGSGPKSQGTALVGGPFALVDQHGAAVSDQDFAGRYMLIYFGYTFCPDFCPMSLTTMTQALDLMAPEVAEQVDPILITIDPERDTVEQLAAYAPLFHPRLVALTGSTDAIKAAAQAYRVYFAKADADDASDYLMDHSTFIYLMGPDGAYLRHFGHTAAAEEIAEAVAAAVAGS